MQSVPPLDARDLDLLVAYSRSSGEDASRAVVKAFLAVNVDVFDRPTTLAEWIDPEALDDLDRSSDRSLCLCARVWGHPVTITAEEVRVYSPVTPVDGSGDTTPRDRVG